MKNALSLLRESPRLIAAMLVTGIGGTFQYGFHISVLNSPSSFIKELVNSTCLQRYGYSLEPWEMTIMWSFIHSIFCIGGLLGSLCAGRLARAYGRKRCLLLNNIVAIIAAVLMLLSKTAMSFEMILVGRVVYGINAGVSLTAHTMYMVECAPKRLRGLVGVSVASFVSMGKFFGQLMGLNHQPAVGEKSHDSEIDDMLKEHAAIRGVRSCTVVELLLRREERWQLLTVLVTFVTLQLCGINAVYLYSLDVFHAAGIPAEQVRYAALGTGLCEVTTSLACIMMIERTGKRVLFFRGYMGMATILGLLTITLNLQGQLFWMPYCSMVLIFLFIFFFSSGPAGVTASLPGDIFIQSSKPAAFTIACCLNWTGLFLIGMVFPLIVKHMGPYSFLIFLGFCFCCGLFVWLNVPETKNRTALEITEEFQKMHTKALKQDEKQGQDKIQMVKCTHL